MNFLKSLGIGLVIIILLPLLLLGATVVGLVLLVEWIVVFVKGSIRFFKGDTFFEPLPEDLIVEEMKAKELREQTEPEQTAPAPQPQQQNVYVTNYYQYPNQNSQATPQPNPYQNNPLDAPVQESIAQNQLNDNVESIPYQEHEAPREAIPLNITSDEGGNEE